MKKIIFTIITIFTLTFYSNAQDSTATKIIVDGRVFNVAGGGNAFNSIILNGATSGTATIDAELVAGGSTLTLPTADVNMDVLISDVAANTAKTSFSNLTGEVTSVGAATTIASGVVDSDNIANLTIVDGDLADDTITEPKLDIFNAPTNGFVLGWDSGNGLQWQAGTSGNIYLHPYSFQTIDSIYVGPSGHGRPLGTDVLEINTDNTIQLTDLTDVNTAGVTSGNVLIADGVDYESRALTSADITFSSEIDLGANSIGSTAGSATGDGTTTIDWGNGNLFNFQFGAFNETFTFTAPAKPGTFILKLVQDSVGSRTATWPASVEWPGGTAPTLTTTATTGTDIITFYYDGTDYFAVSSLDFQ